MIRVEFSVNIFVIPRFCSFTHLVSIFDCYPSFSHSSVSSTSTHRPFMHLPVVSSIYHGIPEQFQNHSRTVPELLQNSSSGSLLVITAGCVINSRLGIELADYKQTAAGTVLEQLWNRSGMVLEPLRNAMVDG